MKYFERLANRVEELRQSKCLADAAHAALSEMPPSEAVTIKDLVTWVASSIALPKQHDLSGDFGDYALTAAHRAEFHIQLLYWKDASTAIHDHGFSGAFTLIAGSSVHVQYEFEVDDETTPHFILGRLHAKSTEVLRAGDVRRIRSGRSLIHSVVHLDRPTISLVIRNSGEDIHRPSLLYRPTLGFDYFRENSETTRKLQHLAFVFECYPSTAEQVVREMLALADPAESYALLEATLAHGQSALSMAPLLQLVMQRHGLLASGFDEAIAFVRRTNNLLERQKLLSSREHQLLLALLLTAPSRSALLQLVATLTGDDPATVICQWLSQISSLSVDPKWGPGAIGINLNERSIKFIHASLNGTEIDAAAKEATPDPGEQAVLALTLPRCSILKPIFTV